MEPASELHSTEDSDLVSIDFAIQCRFCAPMLVSTSQGRVRSSRCTGRKKKLAYQAEEGGAGDAGRGRGGVDERKRSA